jgi:hypothetical protein
MLEAASNKDILVRILRNLKSIYSHHKDWMRALAATERIVVLVPDVTEWGPLVDAVFGVPGDVAQWIHCERTQGTQRRGHGPLDLLG